MHKYLCTAVLLLSVGCAARTNKTPKFIPQESQKIPQERQKENQNAEQQTAEYDFDLDDQYDDAKLDPLEPVNRVVFGFNRFLDTVFLRPVTLAYKKIIPNPIQKGVHNVLSNLYEPLNMVNHLLQGNIKEMSFSGANFVFNSSFGIGGIFSVADKMLGINPKSTSFDETFAKWGVKPGYYIMLPVFGPSTVRGTVATAATWFGDPINYTLRKNHKNYFYIRKGATVIDTHKEMVDALSDLEKNSLDFYAALRSSYYQRIKKS